MIDIQTFMLVLAIGNIAFAMLIAGYARSGPVNAAMQLWQWAKLVQGCAHLLGWLSPDWPHAWLSVAVNCALVIGVMLEAAAYCAFLGFVRWRRILVPATLLALAAFDAARLTGASQGTLTVIMSTIIGGVSGVMAVVLLLPQNGNSVLQRIIGINNMVFCAGMVMRGWSSMWDSPLGLLTPDAIAAFTFVAGYALLIVNGFGFLLLCKQKDDRKLEQLATVDSLTGVFNRRAFFELSVAARMLASRQRHPISLMMLDLDHFKALNDSFGHAAGDQALGQFVLAAQSVLREPDILARMGGEEFAVTLPGTDLPGAIKAAERMRQAVRASALHAFAPGYQMSVSIGVVLVDPDEDINAALARADRALYEAKHGGRDRVVAGETPQLRRAAANPARACA